MSLFSILVSCSHHCQTYLMVVLLFFFFSPMVGAPISSTEGCQTPGYADFANWDVFSFLFSKGVQQKGNTVPLARPPKGVNPTLCSNTVGATQAAVLKAASAAASRSLPAFADLSHRDRDSRASPQVPVSICCFWHKTSDTDDVQCGCSAILCFGCRVVLGVGSFIAVEIVLASPCWPWNVAWCHD